VCHGAVVFGFLFYFYFSGIIKPCDKDSQQPNGVAFAQVGSSQIHNAYDSGMHILFTSMTGGKNPKLVTQKVVKSESWR
jgi:hypothetical protein